MDLLTLAVDPVTMMDSGKAAVDAVVTFGGAAFAALWKYGVGAGALYGIQRYKARPKRRRRS